MSIDLANKTMIQHNFQITDFLPRQERLYHSFEMKNYLNFQPQAKNKGEKN